MVNCILAQAYALITDRDWRTNVTEEQSPEISFSLCFLCASCSQSPGPSLKISQRTSLLLKRTESETETHQPLWLIPPNQCRETGSLASSDLTAPVNPVSCSTNHIGSAKERALGCGFSSQFCHQLAMWPQASCFPSLELKVLIWKMSRLD